MLPVQEILEKLEYLRVHDPDYLLFGASPQNGWGHAYEMTPVMSESEVTAFEQAVGIRLPEDYRVFITQVCSGGPGPGYGLYELGTDSEAFLERCRKPFDFSTDAFNGCVNLGTMGCGIYNYLVINGDKDTYGWMASDDGYGEVFLMDTFSQYYMSWLDDSILQVDGLKDFY